MSIPNRASLCLSLGVFVDGGAVAGVESGFELLHFACERIEPFAPSLVATLFVFHGVALGLHGLHAFFELPNLAFGLAQLAQEVVQTNSYAGCIG